MSPPTVLAALRRCKADVLAILAYTADDRHVFAPPVPDARPVVHHDGRMTTRRPRGPCPEDAASTPGRSTRHRLTPGDPGTC